MIGGAVGGTVGMIGGVLTNLTGYEKGNQKYLREIADNTAEITEHQDQGTLLGTVSSMNSPVSSSFTEFVKGMNNFNPGSATKVPMSANAGNGSAEAINAFSETFVPIIQEMNASGDRPVDRGVTEGDKLVAGAVNNLTRALGAAVFPENMVVTGGDKNGFGIF